MFILACTLACPCYMIYTMLPYVPHQRAPCSHPPFWLQRNKVPRRGTSPKTLTYVQHTYISTNAILQASNSRVNSKLPEQTRSEHPATLPKGSLTSDILNSPFSSLGMRLSNSYITRKTLFANLQTNNCFLDSCLNRKLQPTNFIYTISKNRQLGYAPIRLSTVRGLDESPISSVHRHTFLAKF